MNKSLLGKGLVVLNLYPRALLALAASVVLAGCSQIPLYERPNAPIATQWPERSGNVLNDGTAAAELAWQDFFVDATLRRLVDIALLHNRDLRVAALNIEQARAQLGIRRADELPSVNVALSGSRTPNSSGGITSAYSAGLLVTAYEFDFFGRVASLKEQALAQYLASTEGRNSAQISLIATVAQSWLGLLADEELLALTRQTLVSREASYKLAQLRFQHGVASELDLRLAQSLLAGARVTLAQQQRQRAQDENAFVLLLGQALPTEVSAQLHNASSNPLHLTELPAGLPSDLLTRRPDIRQAEQQLIAANANIGAARAAFFPRISLTVGAGTASGELSGLFKDGAWGFTIAPQLLLPLFDAGRNQAGLDAAATGRDIAVAQYEKAIQIAFREVADALAGHDTLGHQLQAQQAQLDAETSRLQLTNLRYEGGAASQLDWLEAQRSFFNVQQGLVQTRLAYAQNQVMLYKTLGGGVLTIASGR